MKKIRELAIVDYSWTIPLYENKRHSHPFAKVVYISPRGKTRTAYLECDQVKDNLLLVNDGGLYAPLLRLYYYGKN
jgi:hypothetical protein